MVRRTLNVLALPGLAFARSGPRRVRMMRGLRLAPSVAAQNRNKAVEARCKNGTQASEPVRPAGFQHAVERTTRCNAAAGKMPAIRTGWEACVPAQRVPAKQRNRSFIMRREPALGRAPADVRQKDPAPMPSHQIGRQRGAAGRQGDDARRQNHSARWRPPPALPRSDSALPQPRAAWAHSLAARRQALAAKPPTPEHRSPERRIIRRGAN